jgi:hypothetical protein
LPHAADEATEAAAPEATEAAAATTTPIAGTTTHSYESTREAAMAAFAKSWRRECSRALIVAKAKLEETDGLAV